MAARGGAARGGAAVKAELQTKSPDSLIVRSVLKPLGSVATQLRCRAFPARGRLRQLHNGGKMTQRATLRLALDAHCIDFRIWKAHAGSLHLALPIDQHAGLAE